MYIKDKKENVCGKDKAIYTLNGEKFIKQKGKKGDVYVSLEKYIKKKKDKGECLNPIMDKRLQVLNRIFKKSSSVKPVVSRSSSRRRASSSRRRASSSRRRASSSRRRASAARRASSSRRRASAARRASSSRRRASSSFKLSNGRVISPFVVKPLRKFTLSKSIKSKHKTAISGKKPCKKDCVKDDKICNFTSGRCVKPKKEKNVIVKKVSLEKIGARPCKQDCTAINKICKISSRRCVNPPKQKPIITGKNIKPCKKDCVEDKKICNFASGRCIKQKN